MKLSGFILLSAMLSIMTTSCCTPKKSSDQQGSQSVTIPGPKIIIYKTAKDYSMLVPVTLSDDKKSLASYPDVKDVYYKGAFAYPTKLHKGYLLDNRGIDRNVAFLKLSYEEYSKLPKTPSADELTKMVIDPNPLSEMYMYNNKQARDGIEKELNDKIDAGDFSDFTKLK